MSIKNVSVGVWKVVVAARVPWKSYPVVRKTTVKGTKTEAKLKEAELMKGLLAEGQDQGESSLKLGTVASTSKVNTLAEGIDVYLEKLKASGKFSSVTQRKYGWLRRELGHIPIKGIAETFRAWLKEYANSPSRTGKQPQPATINFVINVVKAVCNHLVELEVLPKNPISKAKFPTATIKPREAYLSKDERKRLLDVIQRERPYILPIVMFMLQVPCRAFSELVNATVDQLRGNMIFIPKSKNGDALYKPIPSDMVDYFNSIPDGCPYLFYRKVGETYLPLNNLRHAFEVCRKLAGLPNLRIHDLRHVAVSDLILRGVPTHVLMKIAGWRTDMTRVYFNMFAKEGAEFVLNLEKGALKLAS
jgi:integrase